MMEGFDAVYEKLSKTGACDSPGGMECERVRREWIAEGCPEVEAFIRRHANVVPPATATK